jgi:hypothetical protein
MKEYDQKKVLEFLENHKLTSEWFIKCERQYMMDTPMMVVDVIMNLPTEEKAELISNIDKIELFSRLTHSKMNEYTREVIKYLLGLQSRYQPPTFYKFYGDNDNQEILDAII